MSHIIHGKRKVGQSLSDINPVIIGGKDSSNNAKTFLLDSNGNLLVTINAGTAILGKVGIDQTTDGTTNKVNAQNATHDNLNGNANLQVANTDVGNTNPVPTIPRKSSVAPAAAPVTVNTDVGGTVIAAANANRLSITLQNVGIIPCLVRLGGDASATAYNLILGADTAAKAGNGGSVTIDNFTGAIEGITESSSTVIATAEVVSA